MPQQFCPNCGAPLNPGDTFCQSCGAPVAVQPAWPRSPQKGRSKLVVIIAVCAAVIAVASAVAAALLLKPPAPSPEPQPDVSGELSYRELVKLGNRYLLDGDFDEAVLQFTAAIKIDRKNAEAYTGRGDAYAGLEKFEKAAGDYESAIDLAPEETEIYEKLSGVYISLGEPDRAISILERGIDATGDSALQDILDELVPRANTPAPPTPPTPPAPPTPTPTPPVIIREQITVDLKQVDVSNYPQVSAYFTLRDQNGAPVYINEPRYYRLTEKVGGQSAQSVVNEIRQTSSDIPINIGLVLDCSGSMAGANFRTAQSGAESFLYLLGYNKGDRAAVIGFDDEVFITHFFSGDVSSLASSIYNLYTDGATALYDALFVALNEVSLQSGLKCVVGFTDGLDNSSSVSVSDVLAKSKQLGIPVYIIGLGNEDYSNLRWLANESGGYFSGVGNINDLMDTFRSLYTEQETQICLTYTTSVPKDEISGHDALLSIQSDEYEAEYSFIYQNNQVIDPNRPSGNINENIQTMSGPEKAMYDYQYNFVKSVNAYDFNLLKDYVDPNGPLYGQQRSLLDNYRNRGVKERLIYYTVNSMTPQSDGSYLADVNEQFYIQFADVSAAYKEYHNVYIIRNTVSGYKVSELVSLETLDQYSISVILS